MALRQSIFGWIACFVILAAAGCCLIEAETSRPPVDIGSSETTDGVVGQNADGWKIYRSGTRYELYDPILGKWYPAVRNSQNGTVTMAPEVVEQWRKDRATLTIDTLGADTP